MQEVLFALAGHTGGLLYETKDGYALGNKGDSLSQAERQLIERATRSGFYCKRLNSFADDVRKRHLNCAVKAPGSRQTETDRAPGHYLYAAARRIEVILDAYRERVCDLEAAILREPTLPLVHVESTMANDKRLLHILHDLVLKVEQKQLIGGALLDTIWSSAASQAGDGKIYECLWSIVSSTGQVLVNQMVAWMIYGRLIDPCSEFFVVRSKDYQVPWRHGHGLYGVAVDDLTVELDAALAQREWQSGFSLKLSAVPQSVITPETARKVCFVGKAVRILTRSNKWLQDVFGAQGESLTTAAGNNSNFLDAEAMQREIEELRGCFSAIASPTLVMDRSVERIRSNAALQLRQLVVEDSQLALHLGVLKGFYLLGDGSFYQTFLEESRDLFSRKPPAHAELALAQGPWAIAMGDLDVALEVPDTVAFQSQATARSRFEKGLVQRFEVRFVPKHFDIQRFTEGTRQVKLIGMARLAGGTAELALGSASTGGSAPMFGHQSEMAMLWLTTRQRVIRSFSHVWSFQVHAPSVGSALAGEYGCRMAMCFQHQWAPVDLQRGKHLRMGQFRSQCADGNVPTPENKLPQRRTWVDFGECIAVEVTFVAITGVSGDPVGDVTVAVYAAHPGIASGAPGLADASANELPAVRKLACGTVSVLAPRGKVHSVRLDYDSDMRRLVAFVGGDSSQPVCTTDIDFNEVLSLDLGSAYVGLCSLPLEHQHVLINEVGGPRVEASANSHGDPRLPKLSRDRPLLVTSWTHTVHGEHILAGNPNADECVATGLDAWLPYVELSFRVPWPMPLVITQYSLERYNQLFRLLLAFRHVHMELQKLELPRGELLAWALRAELAYFVSQVLLYFQQDVISVAYNRLLAAVAASDDFDLVVCAHEEFLSTTTAHCFLRTPELYNALMAALRHAAVFCRLAPGPVSKEFEARAIGLRAGELRKWQADFAGTVRSVLRMMASMSRAGMHAQLSQLLLRLDYNGYFSGKAAAD